MISGNFSLLRNRRVLGYAFVFLVLLLTGCYDPYPAPSVSGSNNYLVVSGFLNGDGSCSITLSRSQTLSATDPPAIVSDATVSVEDQHGNKATLAMIGNGVYENQNIPLDNTLTYRLRVERGNGETYLSDYVPIALSPSIDTVGWTLYQQASGDPNIQIYVSSKGRSDQSPYYFWSFAETWKYTAAYPEELKYVKGEVLPNNDTTYFCWKTLTSTGILISSTKQLSENVVNKFLINTIPTNSVKVFDGYSILVTQLSLSQDAFEYWQQLQATTENLGTIFGPLPSQFSGNIHSITNPSEPVFGFFSASTVSQKRIFIQHTEFPPPKGAVITGYEDCLLSMLPAQDISQIGTSVISSSYGLGPVGYNITSIDCVDCRLKGGTNVKPDFWR